MTTYNAILKGKYKNNKSFNKSCFVSDSKYDEDCIEIYHSDIIFYVRKSLFEDDVTINYWEIW